MGSTALVLSAGGMFGAYQAGVWRELSRFFTPDMIVGASVGSLNGWVIASGCDPLDLTEQWLDLGPLAGIRWRFPRSPADGLLDSSALEDWIRGTCDRIRPVQRLGVVLTRLRDLRPTLFESPSLTWEHIASSCAVPLFLRHRRIGGEFYSDGGLVDPLPLWAALQMGATTIVSVNLLKHRPWVIRTAVGAVRTCTGYELPDCSTVRVVDISPSGRLGSARDSMYWNRETAGRWVEQGRQDALRAERQVIESVTWHSTASIG